MSVNQKPIPLERRPAAWESYEKCIGMAEAGYVYAYVQDAAVDGTPRAQPALRGTE